jgi:hypothetical protein
MFTDVAGEWEFFKQPSREPASVHSRTEAQVLYFVVFALLCMRPGAQLIINFQSRTD